MRNAALAFHMHTDHCRLRSRISQHETVIHLCRQVGSWVGIRDYWKAVEGKSNGATRMHRGRTKSATRWDAGCT